MVYFPTFAISITIFLLRQMKPIHWFHNIYVYSIASLSQRLWGMSTISLFHRKSGHIQNKKKSRRVWLIFSWCTKFEQRTSIQPVAGLPSCDMWFWFLPKRGLEKNDVASERCATAVFPCGSTNPRRVYKEVVDSSERISDAVPISSIDKVESSRGGGSINSLWGWSSHLNDRNPFHRYMYISYIYIYFFNPYYLGWWASPNTGNKYEQMGV